MKNRIPNRILAITLILSLITSFLPISFKLKITKYPRMIFLAPVEFVNKVLTNIRLIKKENERLLRLATQLAIENSLLREKLLKSQNPGFEDINLISANIIARDNETFNRFLTIDKGTSDGIRVNMPVITPEGLVGIIIDATAFQSIVETALSPGLKISGQILRSRVVGMVECTNFRRFRFKYTSAESDIIINDTVITSGLGGIFPKGINIGIVTKITQDSTSFFQYVELKPFVNFNTLEVVSVLTNKSNLFQETPKRQLKNLNQELQELKIEVPFTPRFR
ncbi:MAG: rod shape-determining protein MreC [candidate division WOR-3 bacterium]|nr:rod shape-determining protein MreC [candidate division WOR-3 bacterium]